MVADYGAVSAGTADAAFVAQAHVWLGNLAASRGDAAAALAEYQSAATLDAANSAARFNLGVVLLAVGRPPDARDALAAAAALDPNQPLFHFYLGLALEALGDRGAARGEMVAALALDAGCQACRDALGRLAVVGNP